MCPVSSVAVLGSAPAVFCTSGSMWTDFCSPLAVFCAPARDVKYSAGLSHPGPAQQSAPSYTPRKQTRIRKRCSFKNQVCMKCNIHLPKVCY